MSRGSARLAERRRIRRRRGIIVFSILFCLALGVLVWVLWQDVVRISRVDVFGTDTSLVAYADEAMHGSYFGIIPRDSIFFFPESRIRKNILSAHAEIAAVSIFRNDLTSISIQTNDRTSIAKWCGDTPSVVVTASSTAMFEECYVFDANGLIFSTVSSSTPTINTFVVYAPLENTATEPFLATIAHAEKLPLVFDFARQLDTLGSRVTHVVIRDDEVDDYLLSGTRITYVLGHEHNAFTALVSARENFSLHDGSVEYVDLRFDGKVYLKSK